MFSTSLHAYDTLWLASLLYIFWNYKIESLINIVAMMFIVLPIDRTIFPVAACPTMRFFQKERHYYKRTNTLVPWIIGSWNENGTWESGLEMGMEIEK